MKKIKSIILITVLLLLAFTMTCCTYAVDSSLSEESEKNGTDLKGAFAMISFYNYVKYGTGKYLAYKLTYDYSYYQKKKSTLNKLLEELKESFVKNGYTVSVNVFAGEMTASLSFETTEVYLRSVDYNGFVAEQDNYDSIIKTPFYSEYSFKTTTLFTDIDKEYKFIGRIYYVGCVKAGIEKNNVLLQYVYGTPYKEKTIRSNADSIVYSPDNNLYLHIFNMTIDTPDKEVVITQHTPNTPVWYCIAIAAGVVVMSVPLAVYLLKRKKKE